MKGRCDMVEHQEIERKYLISKPDEWELGAIEGCEISRLNQVYLKALRNNVRRLRKLESSEGTKYYFTEKRNITDLGFKELERELTAKEYEMMMDEANPAKMPLNKTRYSFSHDGHMMDIDVYPFWKKQAILEIGMNSEDETVEIPAWIKVIREVTGEDEYRNSIMAEHIPEEQ